MVTYKVRAGDTLYGIAKRFHVPFPSLVAVNAIANPNAVPVGTTLRIPLASTDEMDTSAVVTPPQAGAGTEGGVPIDRTRFALPSKEYYPMVTSKDLIVLHFTAGASAESAFRSWKNDPAHVATAFIVDTDGRVYETFDPRCWAYHLGVKGTDRHDRRSIGIEMANVGPLKPSANDPNVLNWWPPNNQWQTPYCRRDERDRYMEQEYRDVKYFARYTEAQASSVIKLVHQLCDEFGIPRKLAGSERLGTCDPGFYGSFKGVATHANFRQDKWDVGPAFEWDRLGF